LSGFDGERIPIEYSTHGMQKRIDPPPLPCHEIQPEMRPNEAAKRLSITIEVIFDEITKMLYAQG